MVLSRLIVVVLCGCILVGCGSGNPWQPDEVSGKITYEDGSLIPAKSIRLMFRSLEPPKDGKTFPRAAVANVNAADGTFSEVTTYKFGDGLIPGKHRVTVVASDGDGAVVAASSKSVPKEYAAGANSPLIIDTADSPLEIKIRKP